MLAMSFALGLAIFGGALAVGLKAYLAASVDETRDTRARIALESAAATVLGELAAGGELASETTTALDGGRQRILITLPGGKIDLASDAPAVVEAAARRHGFDIDPVVASTADGLAAVSTRQGLNATQEDCLRRAFTYGRGGAPRFELGQLADVQMRAGDQVDLRIHAEQRPGDVLWIRARLTGAATGWRIHDYRQLRGVAACP